MTTEPARASVDDVARPANGGTDQPETANGEFAAQRQTETADGRSPTAAQLRRFIKSRPYVPLHELRRRFELNGGLDDVCRVDGLDGGHFYVGLPEREAELLGQLVRDGEVGIELSRDPRVPVVVGVYSMRPVARGS